MTEAAAEITSGEIPQEDRTLAMLTHLSGLAGYIIPFGGILVPIIIWITKKEDRVISAIAKQAVALKASDGVYYSYPVIGSRII